MMTDRQYIPPDVDTSIPSPARMYDYYLGGRENFPADREAADKALSVIPDGRSLACANRKFLVRAVKYLARNGMRQFIDLGTGIPTSPDVHESTRSVVSDARVAYVDNDPIVVVHNKALLASLGEGITSIRGDIRYPLNIMANYTLRQVISFDQPISVLFVAVLHFLTRKEGPHASVAAFRDRIPSGSHVVISHITSDGTDPTVISAIKEAYRNASAPAVFRSRQEIQELFAGFELIEPGLVEVSNWRTSGRKPKKAPALRFLGGIGRKP